MSQWDPFVRHAPDEEDWSRIYPYTLIGYQLAKRVILEKTYAHEVAEHINTSTDNMSMAVSHIITPNGIPWKRDEWMTKYEEIIAS